MDLDKLIQIALASGATRPCTSPALRAQGWDWIEFKPEQLPVFRERLVADICEGVGIREILDVPEPRDLEGVRWGYDADDMRNYAIDNVTLAVAALTAERDALLIDANRWRAARSLEHCNAVFCSIAGGASGAEMDRDIDASVAARAAIAAGGKT